MDCKIKNKSLLLWQLGLLCLILLTLIGAKPVMAQYDPFGEIDLIYADSVQGAPGQDVTVGFNLINDENLSSFTVPVTYDPTILTLKSVSFENSRAQHLAYRIVTPSDIASIDGHFLVTVLKVLEDPIPAGDGLIFSLTFTVSDSAQVGQLTKVDTLFYEPGGSLLLADDSLNLGIIPLFEPGVVIVRESNRPPQLQAMANRSILEGDSLILDIGAIDPDGDQLLLAATSKPTGATFVDNGDGTGQLVWRPEFVGPFSSEGSAYTISFWTTDGNLTDEYSIEVEVINKNRRPQLTLPESLTIDAGDELSFNISAVDPDFEAISWSVSGLPDRAQFDGNNPGSFNWSSSITDSGLFEVEIIATDPHGFADSGMVTINVRSATIYALTLDTVAAYPNERILFDINLDNQLPIGGFNLLVHYDASALSVLDITNLGSRAEPFEYYNVTQNPNGAIGDLRIVAILDQSSSATIPAGSGALTTIEYLVSSELSFVGMEIPVRFRFLDSFNKDDNTLTGENSVKITQEEIAYANGVVRIRDFGQIKLGDINLNGLAYEISDAIYFTNYFINPLLYSFNPLQYANSDVNQDDIAATVADLVTLINIVVSGGSAPRPLTFDDPSATVTTELIGSQLTLSYEADFPVGGLLVNFETESELDWSEITIEQPQMEYDFYQSGNQVRLLVYSISGETMLPGKTNFVSINTETEITITEIDMATAGGVRALVQFGSLENLVPESFALAQNYPNPFNPETNIPFDLSQAGLVELKIFNVLGREVTTLINREMTAGYHLIAWSGRDSSGASVASGVYFYRLTTSTNSKTRKMVLMK